MPRQKTNCNCKKASVAWGFSCQCCIYGFTIKQPLGKKRKKSLGFSIYQAHEQGITQCRGSCEEGEHHLQWPESLVELISCGTLWWASPCFPHASRAPGSVYQSISCLTLGCPCSDPAPLTSETLLCSRPGHGTLGRLKWGLVCCTQCLYPHQQDSFSSAALTLL